MPKLQLFGFNDETRSPSNRPGDAISSNAGFWLDAALGHIAIAGAIEIWKWIKSSQYFDKPVSDILRTIVNTVGSSLSLVEGFPPEDYYHFVLCMLSIGASESAYSDTAFNPTDQVKGLYQLRPTTAAIMADIYNKPDSAIRSIIDQTKMIEIISSFAPDQAQLLQKVGADRVIDLQQPVSQIPNTVTFWIRTAQAFKDEWKWDEALCRWTCLIPGLPSLMQDYETAVPGAMTDRLLGMQVILTAYHINGQGVLRAKDPIQHLAYLDNENNRYATDCATVTYLATQLDNTKLSSIFGLTNI